MNKNTYILTTDRFDFEFESTEKIVKWKMKQQQFAFSQPHSIRFSRHCSTRSIYLNKKEYSDTSHFKGKAIHENKPILKVN